MDTETGRRLAPLASAATVGTLILGMWQMGGGSAAGPGPDPHVPTPTAAVTQAMDFSGMSGLRQTSRRTAVPAPDPVRVDSYTARGRVLTLDYTITVRDCSSQIARPALVESAGAVTVTLRRVQPPPGTRQVCPEISLANSVAVRLRAALGGRTVRDGSRSGVPVPAVSGKGPTYPPG